MPLLWLYLMKLACIMRMQMVIISILFVVKVPVLNSLFLSVVAATSVSTMPVSTQFDVSQPMSLDIEINQLSYVRGVLVSDKPLKSAVIRNLEGKVVKSLLTEGERESDIYWLADGPDDYQLEIQPLAHQSAQVTLELKTLALKDDQVVSPEQEIVSPLLKATRNDIVSGKQAALDHFWQQIDQAGTPLVEPADDGQSLITFLWRGKVANVRVLGSPYDGHAHLSRLPGSDIWYKSYTVPDDTRFSYRIAPDVPQLLSSEITRSGFEQRRAVLATSQADPLNHQPLFAQEDTRFGAASTLTLAKAPSDAVTQDQGHLPGTVTHYRYYSDRLDNQRTVSIYTPNEKYALTPQSPLLILFDGDAYLGRVPTPTILDNLIAQRKIPAMRAVFVNNPRPGLRGEELTPNAEFADFMAYEFKPYLCQAHQICPAGEDTILSGSSFGGLASLAIAFQHPESFGKVLSQSGSFWWRQEGEDELWITQQLMDKTTKDIEIYLNAGVFEQGASDTGILQTNRLAYAGLKDKGYPVTFEEFSGGHDYFSWRVMLSHGLTQLFKH